MPIICLNVHVISLDNDIFCSTHKQIFKQNMFIYAHIFFIFIYLFPTEPSVIIMNLFYYLC